MATVSARIDDETKNQAEDISDKLGISLNTVINIFLKSILRIKGSLLNWWYSHQK